jgi:hypothetical protein
MTSVLSAVPSDVGRATTLIPFALWTLQGPEAKALAQTELPHLRDWLKLATRVSVDVDRVQAPLLASLTPSHERAWAQAMGWRVVDGRMPSAAWAALARGLCAAEPDASASGWAFIHLCNWHVSNGQVTLGDPAHLQIDEATDATLFQVMQGFFAEDGIVLHPYKPGQWLAQSALFVDLPTASFDRVIGRNIDPWLVGGHTTAPLSPAAQLLRRLQNEMQMLLYTHPVNEVRRLAINSFWIHGTGVLPASPPTPSEPLLVNTLRDSALQQDLIGWLDAWKHVDTHVIAPMLARLAAGESQRLVLCGEHEFHVYDSVKPSLWQRLRQRFAPTSLDTVLAAAPLKD